MLAETLQAEVPQCSYLFRVEVPNDLPLELITQPVVLPRINPEPQEITEGELTHSGKTKSERQSQGDQA